MKLRGFNIFNLIKKQVASQDMLDKSSGIINYFDNRNNFPNEIIKYVDESPAASACISTITSFIEGEGLADENIAKIKANKNETVDGLHAKLSQDLSYLRAFAINVKYDYQGNPTEYYHLPIEGVRLGLPDDCGYISKIHYNPYFGDSRRYKKSETVIYDVFNSSKEVVFNQIDTQKNNYKGQVYFYTEESPSSRFYSKPHFYAGINWFKIDALISSFHHDNINSGFLLNVLMKMVGDPDAASPDPKHRDAQGNATKTVGEVFNDEMDDTFGGATGKKVMVLWSMLADQFPQLEAFPTNTNHDLFLALQQLTIDNISIATKVPPILAGIQVSGKLGNTQEISNSIQYLQSYINKYQRALTRCYREIFKDNVLFSGYDDYDISKFIPVQYIPDYVLQNDLSQDERRELYGFSKLNINNEDGVQSTIN